VNCCIFISRKLQKEDFSEVVWSRKTIRVEKETIFLLGTFDQFHVAKSILQFCNIV
jgi:hypothetical protein